MAKILLVEDDALSRDLAQRWLIRQGYEVVTARDGDQAVAAAQAQAPDLILMDLSLPRVDGWTAAREIKGTPTTRHIPIIVLTAHVAPAVREDALRAGCDEYEAKPIDFPSLKTKIETLLKKGKPQ